MSGISFVFRFSFFVLQFSYECVLNQNIVVNPGLAKAMHAQSGAEREKRARIIESEGERTSIHNYSEGEIVCSESSAHVVDVVLSTLR